MSIGILGRKIGMTRVYDENGIAVPVTAIEAGPCTVVQVKNKERDGYDGVQLGFLPKRDSLLKKPEYYHFLKHKSDATHLLREFRVDDAAKYKSGSVLTAEMFSVGQTVEVTGVSKGKGFQGVMKRHGFSGQRASHGVHKVHRGGGSVGNSADPSRIIKGRKMPGQTGAEKVTIKNLAVVNVDTDKNVILVKGAVPGHKGTFVRIVAKGTN